MSLESLSYRGTETLDKIEGTERGILLGSSISLDFKNTRVAIGHLGNVISQGKVTVSSLIDADSNTWQTSKIITEPSASNGSYFGHAVSMNWAGTRIAVGAYGVDKVYVFDATSTSSNPWATYVSNTISGYTDSNFGYSVSLGQDIDTTLAIGAPNHNRVDIWKLSNSSWSLAYSNIGDDIPNVIPLNSTSGTVTINSKLSSNVSSLQYGFSCKLAPFATHLIVGAPGTPLDAISSANSDYSGSNTGFLEPFIPHAKRQSGSARVLVTTDDWVTNVSQLGQTLSGLEYDGSNYITNSGNLFFPTLGYSVAINFDGSVIAVSAPNRQGGTVRVYEYSSVSSSWEQRGVDITSDSALMTGFSIGLDYTGNRVAMSMISNWSFPTVLNALLYVLDWSGSDWIEAQVPISSKYPGYDYNSNEGTKMLSGYRLDITDGNQVAVSRLWWDDNDFEGDDYYTGSGGSVPLSTAVTTFPANQNAYGRVEFYFFLITATFTGNNIFEGYVTARELRIGPNDAAIDNTIPKRISFGGTTGDNYYDETLIENRVITGSAAELLLHKNHQTNETIDRVRIKASEIHLDHMRMYHSVYQGGQESKDVQSPRFILDQYGTIAIGNLYSGNDSTSTTTSLAETYLDIKAETQIRDKLNVNYKNRSKLLSGRVDYVHINTRCEDLITSSQIIDEKPGHVKVITISNGSGCPYSSTEKAFEFTGTTSGIGQSDITGNWDGDDGMMMFWLKLKSAHSSYSGNVLCSWGETLSTTSGVYRGGCLQLTSSGFTINLGSGIGTRTHATNLDTNKWYHIGVRFPTEKVNDNGVNVNLNALYINGSSVSLSGTLTDSSSIPNWDSQGWHFGYGDASGSISGPAGTFMGNMIFYEDFNPGLFTYGYNDGPPTECLSVGGDATIENRLGVGTVSPTYELDVVGDINFTGGIYQNGTAFSGGGGSSVWTTLSSTAGVYPLSAMSANSSGPHVASASSTNPSDWQAWKAFNKVIGDEGWHSVDTYSSITGNYSGSTSTTYNGSSTVSGEWIQLQFTTGAIATNKIEIAPRTGYLSRCAGDGILLGSNDGSTWTSIHSFSGQTYTNGQYTSITFTTSSIYTYLRLVVTKLSGTGNEPLNISEIRYTSVSGSDIYYNSGNVGIGTSSPQHKLQVGGNVSLGSSSERLFRPTHYYYQTYSGTSGYAYHFLEINNAWTLNVNGFDKMYIRPDTGVLLDDFTGQHRSFVENVWTENINDYIGLIVCANKNTYTSASFATYKGNRAIQINESLPDVRLSNVAYDKSCFGVISSGEDPESREDTYGTITIPIPKERGDTRTFINSVGEGAIWVTNINGSLESGDYITTSNIVGYGQKQDSEFLANYTVAKITMDCDFNPKIQPVKQIKKELGNVEYWIKYKIKVISQEEYNVLPDTQRRIKTNADGNDKYYQLIYEEKTIEDPLIYEIENYVWIHESREEMINSIDENGIFIWEDHPTETEKAYKIRYLDSNGMETDEANHVYKAAFVGCTYHCG